MDNSALGEDGQIIYKRKVVPAETEV